MYKLCPVKIQHKVRNEGTEWMCVDSRGNMLKTEEGDHRLASGSQWFAVHRRMRV